MVDQEKLNERGWSSTAPPEEPAEGINGLLHRLVLLVDLQVQLLRADVRDGLHRLILAAVLLGATVAMSLAALFVALLFIAELLADLGLYRSAAFIVAAIIGAGLTALLAVVAVHSLRTSLRSFDRSREEWGRTMRWVKEALANAKSSRGRHNGKE
jgi:hypothetical protein